MRQKGRVPNGADPNLFSMNQRLFFLSVAGLLSGLVASAQTEASTQTVANAQTAASTQTTANAQNQSEMVYSLDSVSVSGSRIPLSLNTSARIVTIMDSYSIANTPADNVNDLLKYSIGTDVRQRGVMGMQTDISIRGGNSDQIAVLLNGINISDPQTGHNAADFPVSAVDIDRIEILEGPAARVYGTSSLVGAVNVITRAERSNYARAQVEGGSFGYVSAGAAMGLSSGRLQNHLSLGYSRSDGYTHNAAGGPNSDFSSAKLFWHGAIALKDADINAQAGMSVRDFGANTFYSSRFDDQFEHTFKTFAAVKADIRGKVNIHPSIYWNRAEDRFELFRGRADKYPFNYHRTNVAGAALNADISTALGRTTAGAEYRWEGIVSTNLGEPLPGGGTSPYVCGLGRSNISLYLEHNVILQRFTASAGLSAVRNTGNDEGFRLYPGMDMSLRLGSAWKLYGSFNTSFRMPTFTELYYSVGGHKADKNLKAEKLMAFEGGIKFAPSGFSAVLSVYYHKGYDMIDWIRDNSLGEDAPWMSVNHTVLNSLGEEITMKLDFPTLLGRPGFPVRSLDLGYSHISQDKSLESHLQSLYAMEYLRHKVVAKADLQLARNLLLDICYRFQDREGNSAVYKPYSIVDAKLKWQRPRTEFYIKANNLLNAEWYDFGDIPQPGIWVMGGVVFNL